MGDFADLHSLLESLLSGEPSATVDPADLGLHLQSFRARFLKLLSYKGPNQTSRQQVEALLVNTPDGEIRLDAEPDKRLALQLSAALNLDEVLCVQYLVAAQEAHGSFTAESAAGYYLSERQAAIKCLLLLLTEVANQATAPQDTPKHAFGPMLHDFVVGLLSERTPTPENAPKGPQVLLTRLIEVLSDTSLEVTASSDLQEVRDEAGLPVSRASLLQMERRMTAKSLLYCLVIDQRAAASVVASLLDLLVTHYTRTRPGVSVAHDAFHTELGQLLVLCLVLALTPQEERGTQERAALVALLGSADVKAKIFPPGSRPPGTPQPSAPAQPGYQLPQVPPPILSGPFSVLRLCWGVLIASASAPQPGGMEEAKKLMQEVPGNRTFTYLKQFFASSLYRSDTLVHQDIVACCVYRLVGQALQADTKLEGALYSSLEKRLMLAVKRTGGGGVAFSPLPPDHQAARWDHLGSVLALLASVFGVAARLWLVPDGGYAESQRLIESLITRTVTHDAMKVSPEVRIPFFEMMTSLASGEYGASLVLRQFAEIGRTASLEVLSWRKLMAAVVEYCVRYNTVIEEAVRSGQGGNPTLMLRGQEERLMNSWESGILVAALGLLRRIIESGSLADVRGFLEGLERETAAHLSGYSITEPFFQLMCHPVPNTVKASLDSLLAAIAHRFPATTGPALLERLMTCAVVSPGAAPVPGVPRLDITTQLNEIEARKEEYPETLAFINLLNSLVSAALLQDSGPGGAGRAAGDGAQALAPFTGFVVQHVLAHLWQRGYRRPSQKWELAAVALQHLELMMEVAYRSGTAPLAVVEKQAPGWSIMHDILGQGPSLQALLQVLAPGYEDITAAALQAPTPTDGAANGDMMGSMAPADGDPFLSGTGAAGPSDILTARQAAALAALRVLNKALQLDEGFVAAAGRASLGSARYLTLDGLIQGATWGAGGGMTMAVLGGMGMGTEGGQLVATLLQYVSYQDSEAIQVEAIRLAQCLAQRNPSLVDQLSSGGGAGRSDGARVNLRSGMAVALRDSLASAGAIDSLDEALTAGRGSVPLGVPPVPPSSPSSPSLTSDPRAALILKLLLDSVDAPASPTITHLLMGYDPEPSMSAIEDSMLLPKAEYSCLTVLERFLTAQRCALSVSKPQLYAQMLRLVYGLASHPRSGPPMLEYLSPSNVDVIPNLRQVLVQPLPQPTPDTVLVCASSMHQRSWIMRLQALLLLRLDHAGSIQGLLTDLLVPSDPADVSAGVALVQAGRGVAGCTLMQLLQGIVALRLQEPQLSDLSPETRRLQSEMSVNDISVEALLVQPHVQASLGVHMLTAAGDVLFDVSKVYTLIMQRYEQYMLRNGQPSGVTGEAALDAIRATLRYVQQYNAYQTLAGGQTAAGEGWMHVTEIAFTRQYQHFAALVTDAEAAQGVMDVLMAALQGSSSLLSGPSSAASLNLAGILVNVARVLLAKLQELGVVNVSLGQASDPLILVRTPARCAELLRLLLDLTEKSRRAPAVRVQLYAALLQYTQFCKGSKMGNCAPVVLQAVLEGQEWRAPSSAPADGSRTPTNGTPRRDQLAIVSVGGGNGAGVAALVAQLDAAQEAIERSNTGLINAHGHMLVDVASRDALDSNGAPLKQAVALQLLAALVAISSSGGAGAGSSDAMAAGGAAGAAYGLGAGSTLCAGLYQQAVPQALLQGLTSLSPSLLVTPTRQTRQGVFVVEAQLALLLALEQAGSTSKARQLSAQAFFALQPVQHLMGCRALDLEPEEPGRMQPGRNRPAEQHMDTLRARLQHLLPPVLRLVLGLVAALPESTSVRQEARLFVGAHCAAIQRVLLEAAGSGTTDWSPGEPELEQAELATGLLSRLVPVWHELGPLHGASLRTALFRLAAAFCCLDNKSNSPIVRSLHTNTAGGTALALANGASADTNGSSPSSGGNRAALLARAGRVASLRAALARFLRDLVAHAAHATPSTPGAGAGTGAAGGAVVPFRCIGHAGRPEVDPYTSSPTLLLAREAAEQACLDAGGALEELEDLLGLLRAPDLQLDDRTCVQKLLDYGPQGGRALGKGSPAVVGSGDGGAAALVGGLHARRKLVRHYLALAASNLDSLLGKALFVLENSLAIIVLHFLRYLPSALPDLGGAAGGGAGARAEEMLMAAAALGLQGGEAGAGAPDMLGSTADLTYLATRLQETCLKAEELLNNASKLGLGNSRAAAGPVLGAGGSGGGGAGAPAVHAERLQGIDLLVRTTKSYLSRLP